MEAPNRIRELRTAKGWSQQTLADKLNVSKPTISDLERGSMQLTQHYMQRLSVALGCPAAEILPRDDNPFLLSEEEKHMIKRMRAAHAEEREKLRMLADVALSKNEPSEDTKAA